MDIPLQSNFLSELSPLKLKFVANWLDYYTLYVYMSVRQTEKEQEVEGVLEYVSECMCECVFVSVYFLPKGVSFFTFPYLKEKQQQQKNYSRLKLCKAMPRHGRSRLSETGRK